MRIQISLRAKDLTNPAHLSFLTRRTFDPYAILSVSDGGTSDGREIGTTKPIKNQLNPTWPEIFITEDYDEYSKWMNVKVRIYARKTTSSAGRLLGEVGFEVTQVLESPGRVMEIPVNSGGSVYVHVNESAGSPAGSLVCQLRALDVENTDAGLLGLGAVDPFFEISKKYFDAAHGRADWHVVYRSEHERNTINPLWERFALDLERLCDCDVEKCNIKITVWNHKSNGAHRELGSSRMTVRQLLSSVSKRGNADRTGAIVLEQADEWDGETSGVVVVVRAELQNVVALGGGFH